MACIVMAKNIIPSAYTVMAYIDMACIVMAKNIIPSAYTVMAYIDMACIVMAKNIIPSACGMTVHSVNINGMRVHTFEPRSKTQSSLSYTLDWNYKATSI